MLLNTLRLIAAAPKAPTATPSLTKSSALSLPASFPKVMNAPTVVTINVALPSTLKKFPSILLNMNILPAATTKLAEIIARFLTPSFIPASPSLLLPSIAARPAKDATIKAIDPMALATPSGFFIPDIVSANSVTILKIIAKPPNSITAFLAND